ncbi:MAG: SDR family NAD(P)-dependent oxidoreductase [Chlorobiales bacterium]|jgi:3-oxoacyl-[acyl-carrier protein] reductase|nr:SDR family NAD(P)-dependent oxidoreductase [Chlorobiales bacterium]
MDFTREVAVITGSSSGIGLEAAQELVERGATVYGLSRRPTPIEAPNFTWIKCDVRKVEDIDAAFDTILAKQSAVSIFINNAGLGVFGGIESLTPEDWKDLIDTNLTAAFLCTRRLVPGMKEHERGYIFFIGSIAGKVGFKGGAGYNASNFGLAGFAEALMHELRDYGVHVSSLFPGTTNTQFFGKGQRKKQIKMQPRDIARIIMAILEMPDYVLIDQVVMRPLSRW